MLRILAALGAVCGCALVGINASARLKRRRDALNECVRAVRRLEIGVTHSNKPVHELLRGCGEEETGVLFQKMAELVEKAVAPLAAYSCAVQTCNVRQIILQQDERVLERFFSALGASERNAQGENAEMAIAALTAQLAEAETTFQSKGRVYRTMGVLLGAGVGILML